MKKIILLAITLIFLVGCISLPQFAPKKQLVVGSGIKMEFDPAPREITGPFRLGLKFTNNNPSAITGNLLLRDITTLKGFDDISQSVYLEPALIEYSDEPDPRTGEQVVKLSSPSVKYEDFGTIEYEEIVAGATAQFLAEFNFDYTSNLRTQICVSSFGSRTVSCPENEMFSGNKLGLENQFAPIVASVTKTAKSRIPGQALLELNVELNNIGGGELDENDILLANVDLVGDGVDLRCDSSNAVSSSGNQFEIRLQDNRAKINCFADVSFVGDLTVNDLFLSLSYPYKLKANTGAIKVQ